MYIFMSFEIFSQTYPRLNNYWDHLYSLNPAAINDDYQCTLFASSRQQWQTFEGAPRTYISSATVYFDDYYTQLGIKVMSEPKGVTDKLDVSLSYSYKLLLSQNWRMNLGLGFNFQNFSYDVSQLIYPTAENPMFYERQLNTNQINSNLGLELYDFYWKFGFSAHNILTAFKKENNLFPFTSISYVQYRQRNSDWVNWGGGLSMFQYGNIFQSEIIFNAFVKKTYETDQFQLGLFYRTWHEIGLIYGMNFEAFNFRLSYDYNMGLIRYHSLGTAELSLTYKFDFGRRCRNCGWIR